VGSGAVLERRDTLGTPSIWRFTTRAPTRRFPCRWWHRPTAPRGNVRQLSYVEMSASTRQDRLGMSTTRGGACRGASFIRIEARGKGLEQSPRPAGTGIRGACTGVAIVNRRSASGGEVSSFRRVVLLANTRPGRKSGRAYTHGVDRGKAPQPTNTSCVTKSLLARVGGLEATLTPHLLISFVPLGPSGNPPQTP